MTFLVDGFSLAVATDILAVANSTEVNAWVNLANNVDTRRERWVKLAEESLLGCFGLGDGDDVHLNPSF
jgi:hypothetical protein